MNVLLKPLTNSKQKYNGIVKQLAMNDVEIFCDDPSGTIYDCLNGNFRISRLKSDVSFKRMNE